MAVCDGILFHADAADDVEGSLQVVDTSQGLCTRLSSSAAGLKTQIQYGVRKFIALCYRCGYNRGIVLSLWLQSWFQCASVMDCKVVENFPLVQ